MKKLAQLLFISYCVFVSNTLNAQESFGYYGKKTYLQGNLTMNTPFLYNRAYKSEILYTENTLLKKDNFNFGVRLSAGIALKRSFGLALETGFDYSSVYVFDTRFDTTTTLAPQTWVLTHENLDAKTTNFAVLMEFSAKSGLLPMGLSHQVGINFTSSSFQLKDYRYTLTNYVDPTVSYSYANNPLLNIKGISSVKKIGLIYNMNMRKPLNKSLFLNYGFKYSFNFLRIGKNNSGSRSYFSNQQTDINTYLSRSRLTQILYFYAGLAFAF